MFDEEEIKVIKGCLLTTKEIFGRAPFKTKDIKDKIIAIDYILEKINNL